jgi:HKD family nuclease
MRILTNPWKQDFLNLVEDAKKSIRITSPFVKETICKELFNVKNKQTTFELITSFKMANALSGSLDLSGLEYVLNNEGIVKNYPRLHSKIYIFDETKAVITSGNLTNGGLITNFEYGIFIDDEKLVANISNDFNLLSNSEITGTVKKEHILKANEILSKIPKINIPKIPFIEIETPEVNFDIVEDATNSISTSLTGWKLDVFNCLISINKQEFTLNEVYFFEKKLKEMYPNNQNIKAKIRQQIQFLRDLGLIEFLANGKYKKLWN